MLDDHTSPRTAGDILRRLRERRPRVHCITNSVVENFVANVLLAAGCVPSMTISAREVADFVGHADALAVNLGTLDEGREAAIGQALGSASRHALPWVLDPVFVERSASRLAFARNLLSRQPAIVRANTAEIAALCGHDGPPEALAHRLAAEHGTTVAMTGVADLVADGTVMRRVEGGHPFLAKVTGAGCATTALMAGFLAVEPDAPVAAAACLAFIAVAAEQAGRVAAGPGSFVPAFVDRLHAVSPDDAAMPPASRTGSSQ